MNVERTGGTSPANKMVAIIPHMVLWMDVLIAVPLWMFREDILGERADLMAYVCASLVLGGLISFFVLKKTLNKIIQ